MIDALGGAPTGWAPQSAGANSWLQGVLEPVAEKLGTSASSLLQQLQGGASLSEVADQQGVSRSDLIAAIEQGLRQSAPAGSGASAGLADLANRIADRHGLHGAHRHHRLQTGAGDGAGQAGGPAQGDLAGLASLLQLSPGELVQQLQGGASLLDLAGQRGVAPDALAAYLQPGLAFDEAA